MDARKEHLLATVVEEYTRSAAPVGSKFLSASKKFGVSPATIRNELSELERLGYVTHPHTSAGRMPTEKGYQYYVENYVTQEEPAKDAREFLKNVFAKEVRGHEKIKNIAKGLAEFSGNCVFVGFSKNNFFYTGFSTLFSQPEFQNHGFVCSMSEVLDRMDETVADIYDTVRDAVEIRLGENSPFGNGCGTLLMKTPNNELMGIVGPIRMDYQKNFSLLHYTRMLIHKK